MYSIIGLIFTASSLYHLKSSEHILKMAYKDAEHICNFQGVDRKKKFASFCHVELFLPLIKVFLNLVILTLCLLSQKSGFSVFILPSTGHFPLSSYYIVFQSVSSWLHSHFPFCYFTHLTRTEQWNESD